MKSTALYEEHQSLDAKMIDFGGWQMPVQYSGIIDEHKAVRNKAGIFDVSHMGEILISGKEALDLVQKIITNDASKLTNGDVLYTPMCYQDGGIVDDLLVYRIDVDKFLLVVNASNTTKDFRWVEKNAELFEQAEVEDKSDYYGLIALQGPISREIIQPLLEEDISNLKYYTFIETDIAGVEAIVSRTGYTGELGFEVYLKAEDAVQVWNAMLKEGSDKGLKPAGLGARDTLRLEKALCLYGNDIDETTNPLEANLGWTVKFDKEDFNGKEALEKVKEDGVKRTLVGFIMQERGIPRHGYEIKVDGEVVGEVTSGSYSPTLDENIGLAYVDKKLAEEDTELDVCIRKREVKAKIFKTPFI
ncbi:MAG TPA: glycine cleavage system aminomethyltransferase GcvT [Halanaerobiales bacterium]|nr:glycine cleavage system aminomethyltransferase GcvT [Halanaerobiales bacterium]